MGLERKRRDERGADAAWSDARPADGPARGRVSAEEWQRRRRVRRRLVGMLFALVFVVGSAAALFARGGYFDRVEVERELEATQREFFARAARVRELRTRAEELEAGGAAMERIAREELNLVREGEITFLLAEEDPFAGTEDGEGDRTDRP